MQRGGRVRDVSDWSAGRIGGRGASRAAQQQAAVKEQDVYGGDEDYDDDITSGVDYPDDDDADFGDVAADHYYGE